MRFQVLGSLEALHEGERVPVSGLKAKALALLLLEPGQWIPAQRFTDLLWDDEPPSTAVRQVQNTLAALRRLLSDHGGDPIERSGLGYRLDSEDIDLIHFERAVSNARKAMRAGDANTAASQLEAALGLWRGSALADLSGNRFEAAASRLEGKRLGALEALNDAELSLGRTESVVPRARELLDADPYHQKAAAQLMHALRTQGRGVEALEVYTGIRTRLADELGLDPDPELREAQRRALETEPENVTTTTISAATSVPAQLPAAVGDFCAREVGLAGLDEMIASEPEALRIAVVSGTAGVGKTSLAVEWAHRVRDGFPGGQLYVNLRGFDHASVLDPAEALHGFLTALGVGPSSVPRDSEARADLYRSLTADRRMLVLLDNARDAEQVRPLLPGSPGCVVVVTTRRLLPSLAASHGARQLRLSVFDRSEARELLGRRLGADRIEAEPEAVQRILTACAGLPLALAVAAARAAAEPGFPLRVLAKRLSETEGALDALETGDLVGDVRAVFSWSYEALSPDAARLFRFTGLHPGPDFSAAAAASLANISVRRARALLRELTGAHLLIEHRPDRYSTHDLLAAYARETVEASEGEAERASASRRMLSHYLGTALNAAKAIDPFDDPLPTPGLEPGAVVESFADTDGAMAWSLAELRVLGQVIANADNGFDAYATSLASAVSGVLLRSGDWDIGLSMQQCALRAARRLGDRRHETAAHAHTAMFLFSEGDFEAALRHLGQARDLCDPERDRKPLARVHHRFAKVLNEVRRFEEALDHCREAYRLFLEIGDDDGQADTLNGIGWLLAELGRYDEALEHCLKSLALSESIEALGAQAEVHDSIGYVLHRLGRHCEAIDHYRRAAEVSRRIGFRPNEAQAYVHLGDLYRSIEEPVPAREHWRRALAIFEETREYRADQVRAKLAELEADRR